MTILSVLKHHGHHVTPIVDSRGRITFIDANVTVFRGAAAVKPHTFHGGEDPAVVTSSGRWWESPGALDLDRAAVKEYFPEFIEETLEDEPPRWVGKIDTGYGTFEVAIQHRPDHGLPLVVPMSPARRERPRGRRMATSPHTYLSGNLCVAAQSDWDAATDTIATVIGWAAHWHALYVVWRIGMAWPSNGYQPNAA